MPSRAEELQHINAQIEKLQEEANKVLQAFRTYEQQVRESIQEILKEAGVFDEVKDAEMDILAVKEEAQKKLNALQEKARQLAQVREYLLQREQEDPGTSTEAEGTPEEIKAELEPEIEPEPDPKPEQKPETRLDPKPVRKPVSDRRKPERPKL